jgi:hypothetical protein
MGLDLQKAYKHRNEYDPEIQEILIKMMHKERLHQLWMRRCADVPWTFKTFCVDRKITKAMKAIK